MENNMSAEEAKYLIQKIRETGPYLWLERRYGDNVAIGLLGTFLGEMQESCEKDLSL